MLSLENPDLHEVANLFPMMSESEYQDLKTDIEKNGLHTEIVTWRGQVIDGRHRIRALTELGRDWRRDAVEMDSDADPVAYAVGCNLKRRHLTKSQLAMIGDKIRDIYDTEAAERRKATEGRPAKNKPVVKVTPVKNAGKKSRDKAGEAMGVSGSLIDAAKKVRTKGTPALQKAVTSGKASVKAAAEVAEGLSPEKQDEVVKTNLVKEAAADLREKKQRASASKKVADAAAVKSVLSAKNPVAVIETVLEKLSQEDITSIYLRCADLLPNTKGSHS